MCNHNVINFLWDNSHNLWFMHYGNCDATICLTVVTKYNFTHWNRYNVWHRHSFCIWASGYYHNCYRQKIGRRTCSNSRNGWRSFEQVSSAINEIDLILWHNSKNNDTLMNFYSFSTIKVWLKWEGMYHEVDLWACRVAGSSIQWSTWKSSWGPILVSLKRFRFCYTLYKLSNITWYKIENMLWKYFWP